MYIWVRVFFCNFKGACRDLHDVLYKRCNCVEGHCIADDPMGTSSFIIPARLYNAWEILTVITAASQGFLPRPTGFRDSANYGSGMDLQCLIYYLGWAGLKAPPENYWRIKRTRDDVALVPAVSLLIKMELKNRIVKR